ncbi:MAG: nucleotidyltransferase domain-containing protein [Candidatus Acidiferrales bacterium]
MIDLGSKLRRDLLAYYFTNPQASHYLRELARRLDADPANLARELARLEEAGLFVSEPHGRQKYYRLNRRYPLFDEVRGIVRKTVGVASRLRAALEQVDGVGEAYLFGSFARNQQDAASDIDVLVVGEPRLAELESVVRRLERQLGREINYTVLSRKEFRSRKARRDPFLSEVTGGELIDLVGAR